MNITDLQNTTAEELHEAFVAAFSNYQITLDMPPDKFHRLLKGRDYHPQLSVGCFIDGTLVGFLLVGSRMVSDVHNAYDIATGVISEYQQHGIASRLLRSGLAKMNERNVEAFWLEVFVSNESALRLYEKHNFRKVRKLKCYEAVTAELMTFLSGGGDRGRWTHCTADLKDIDISRYQYFQPTWQNAAQTYWNLQEDYITVTLKRDNELIGYGIVNRVEGDILQFGVLPQYRGDGAERELLRILASMTAGPKLKCINIEENSSFDHLLNELGFINFIDQFEMKCDVTSLTTQVESS